jgi:nucleoid-associated protein YgaU
MTQVFVLLAALILVFFVVRLAYRYAADRPVGTPSRRWTACAELGGIAVLIVVAVLAYVQRSVPPRSAASDAEHAARVRVGTSTAPDAHVSQARMGERQNRAARGKEVGTGPDTAPAPPVLAPVADASPPSARYVVHQGDTLSRIAGSVYGDGSPQAWKRIYDANKAAIGADPSRLRIGMQLTIPNP